MIRYAKAAIAVAMIAVGLCLAVFGHAWAPVAFELLAGSEIGAWLELVVPFLPVLFIGLGAALIARRTVDKEIR